MFWKIILLCGIGHFACIKAEDESTSIEQKIRDKILKDIPTMRTDALWNVTAASDQYIQYAPLSVEVLLQVIKIEQYYDNLGKRASNFENDDLKEAYALAGVLDKLSSTSNAKMKFLIPVFINYAFYKDRDILKTIINDLKTYYHADIYELWFDTNPPFFAKVNEWLSDVKKAPISFPQAESSLGRFKIIKIAFLSFTSCWDTPKIWTNFVKLLKFRNSKGEFYIETFNAKETIGYYNNAEKKYEAIRLPYKKGEFAMIVVLPYQGQSLESISEFTGNDHKQLLQRVNGNYKKIDYAIPFMNFTQMMVNENGTAINGDDTIICDWPTTTVAQETQEINKIDYKPFYVNRPFAVYVYHEKTKFVMMYVLVNNPALGTEKFRLYRHQVKMTNKKIEL